MTTYQLKKDKERHYTKDQEEAVGKEGGALEILVRANYSDR
jgi:hypothetical protein